MKNLLLIDGHYFLWRSYSVPFKFFSKNGTPLHVLTTFLKLIRRSILALEENKSPCTHIAIVFDSNSPLSKQEIFSEYKANRKDISLDEENPYKHLSFIFQMLEALDIKYFMEDGIEGDELLGTIATKFTSENEENKCFIGSVDTDFYQLVCEKIKILKLGKKDKNILIDSDFIYNALKIRPSEYIYHKCLTGDKADNIPGIPNIGPIRASRIINKEIIFDLQSFNDVIERNQMLIKINCCHNILFESSILLVNTKINQANQIIFENCNF